MYSLVVPVYKNSGTIETLLQVVDRLNEGLDRQLEAVFVVDGSPDDCLSKLQELLPLQRYRSKLLTHSRNFGSFPAIRSGLIAAEGPYFAVMAADLQEPPELISQFYSALQQGEWDIVVGYRESRTDPLLTRLMSAVYWGLYRKFVVHDLPPGGVDVFACNLEVRNTLLNLEESHSSLVSQLYWIGFRRKEVAYTRLARANGKSAWTLQKKMNYFLDSIFAFTDLPIKLLLGLGFTGLIVSLFIGITAFVGRLTGLVTVSGYAALIITVSFFGAVSVLGLGIVGSYAHRTYENSKKRPIAIVGESKNFRGLHQP